MNARLVYPIAALMLIAQRGDAATGGDTVVAATVVQNLTLEGAFEMAERLHPQLAEMRALVEAAEGRARQAGAFPNPEAILGAQQLPLDGNASNQREYIAGVAQPIPLGPRLKKAREAEWLEREMQLSAVKTTRSDLRKRIHSAFATALYQERAFRTLSQISDHVERTRAIMQARLEAGDAVSSDLAVIEMELARARLELDRARALHEQSLIALAAAMGDVRLRIASLAGALDEAFEIPALESLAAGLAALPESQLAETSVRASAMKLELAMAQRIPDVKIEALYHRLEATRENTFELGVSIPWPLFDRNAGRVREARAETAAAEARARSTRNALTARLQEAHRELTTALAGSKTLQTEILPRAEVILKSAEARFAAGDVGLSELLPVRRDWASVQLSHLESLRTVMEAWARLRPFAEGTRNTR